MAINFLNNGAFAGLVTATKTQNATSIFTFQNSATNGTAVRTHLFATAGNRSIRLEAIHSDYSYVVSNNTRMYFQTNDGSNNPLFLDGDNATFTGAVGIGTTGIYSTDRDLNLSGKGISIKNNITGSNNNWSYIHNTATGSNSNLVFATGASLTALTLEHGGDAIFAANVGIGTTNPDAKLDVASATGNVGFNYGTSSSPERGNLWYNTDGSGWKFNIGKVQSSAFTSQVTIQDNGNVGIGETSPTELLHLKSGAGSSTDIGLEESGIGWRLRNDQQANDFRLSSVTGTFNSFVSRLVVKQNGNVGIGTESPDNISSAGTVLSISTQGALTTNSLAGSLTFLTNDPSFLATYVDGVTTEISSISESATGAAYGIAFSTSTITGSNRDERMRIGSAGAIKFNAYGAGYLKSDASGNITAAGAGQVGPFLPLTGGTLSGDLTANGDVILGGSAADPKEITIQQITEDATENTAIMIDGNGVLRFRNLDTGAFGPTPVGAFLPLAGGTLTGNLQILRPSTSAAQMSLRRDATGDGDTVGEIQYLTTAAPGGDNRLFILRTSTQGGTTTTRGGKVTFFSRKIDGGFNSSTYDNEGNWVFANNVIANGNIGLGTTNPVSQLNSTKVIKLQSTGNNEIILDHTDGGVNSDLGLYSWERNNDHLAHIRSAQYSANDDAFIAFHCQPTGGSFANSAANEKMRILPTGDVGIGTTTPNSLLHMANGSGLTFKMERTGASASTYTIANASDRITHDYVGGSAGYVFAVEGTNKMTIAEDGDVVISGTTTSTNFILSSDKRLKENIKETCDNRIKADWKTFELKSEKGQKRYGVIAQELEKTNPEFVREDTQGFKSVAYIDLLIAKIAELEARLEKAGI